MRVFFDVDATLCDSEPGICAGDVVAFKEAGIDRPGLYEFLRAHLAGSGSRAKYDAVIGHYGLPADESAYATYRSVRNAIMDREKSAADQPGLFPGVAQTLAHVHARHTMAAVSNNPVARSRTLLSFNGIEHFFSMVIGPDTLGEPAVDYQKPRPAMIVHACAVVGDPADGAVMVGDSLNDVLAAKAAGVMMIGYVTLDAAPAVADKLSAAGAHAIMRGFSPALWDDAVTAALKNYSR